MIRRVFRSHCESFTLVEFHRVAFGEERIAVTAGRAAMLLESLWTDPFNALELRRLATDFDPWCGRQDNPGVIARLVTAIVHGRLVMLRVEPPRAGIPGGAPPREEPGAEAPFDSARPPVDETHWLEIQLFDEDSAGIPGARYLVIGPDGRRYRGYTDSLGTARISRLAAGRYQVSFPDLDASACEQVTSRGGA